MRLFTVRGFRTSKTAQNDEHASTQGYAFAVLPQTYFLI